MRIKKKHEIEDGKRNERELERFRKRKTIEF